MVGRFSAGALLALAAIAGPVGARTTIDFDDAAGEVGGGGGLRLPGYLQCVPYARQVSGIQIFGDARTWWDQAEGRYARGHAPRVGAVMAFRPYAGMRLGHVAAVSDILDSRTVLLRHANWSPINGRRGQVEDDVRAVDVSPNNDWSQVRVWFAPIQALGGTAWPVEGFIYNQKPGQKPGLRAPDTVQLVRATPYKMLPAAQSKETVEVVRAAPYKQQPGPAVRSDLRLAMGSDPIGDIIARRGR
jgi:surface antigen